MIERAELAPGYRISRLVHGGWQFSAGHRLGGAALDDALEVLVASADLGVTTFDCADIYTGVEELYGRFLARWRTTSSAATPIQIHTKFVPDRSDLHSVDRAYVRRIVERSLTRLGVERLDLVQFYWWRDDVPGMEDAARWLAELRDEGKIRLIGVTNMDVDHLRRLEDAGVAVVADQVQYSLLDRRSEATLQPYALEHGVGLLAFGALAGGFLTDRWLGRADPGEAASRSQVKYRLIVEEAGGWEALERLLSVARAIADESGVSVAAVALRFVLDQPAVAAVVVGATRLGQMERNLDAFRLSLSDADHARLRSALPEAVGPAGPVFGLESDPEGPHGRIMRYDLNRA